MSKMNELSAELDELRRCGEILIGISNTLKELFSTAVEENPVKENKKKEPEKKALTLTDVRAVLAEKSRNGYTADVKALLIKFGADKLSDINPTDYEALLAEAEVFGNA